jgi:putative tricarboxylic transport membrane protein
MRLKSGQDLATGLLFIAVGLAALLIGADYPLGTPQRPGTGVLPRILAWCLIGTGALVWLKALFTAGPRLGAWAWRPAIMITLAVVAFALTVDRLGLVLAMLAAMTLTALGTPETRWREYALFAAIMLAIGIGVFRFGLGMPISVLPRDLVQALYWSAPWR